MRGHRLRNGVEGYSLVELVTAGIINPVRGIPTVGNGVPGIESATMSTPPTSTSIGATTMVNAPASNGVNCGGASNASCYRVSFYVFQVVKGQGCTSDTGIAVNVIFTDPSASTAATIVAGDFVIPGDGAANTPVPLAKSGSGVN